MQTSRTTSFIESKDLALNRYSRVGLSRAWVIKKSSRKASSASMLFTHNSKGHEKFFHKQNNQRNASKSAAPNPGTCQLFSASWYPWLWRPGGTVWIDGEGAGPGPRLAYQTGDAGCHSYLAIASGTSRDPGWHFCLLSSRWLLGRMGRRLGLYPAQFPDCSCAWRALCQFWGAFVDDSDFLWRQPCRYRADPAFMLAAGKAWDGGLAAVGDRGNLFRCNDCISSGTGNSVHRRGHNRNPLLRFIVSPRQAPSGYGGDGTDTPGVDDRQTGDNLDTWSAVHLFL